MAVGTRYPTLACITQGVGQADEGIPPQPFETFCYDSALLMAKIENFNVVHYTSVLPKQLFGHIYPVDKVSQYFTQGAVLEVIMAGHGASIQDHKAIATGLGVCWGRDPKTKELIGGWAAEYVEFFDTKIDDQIAKASAEMWLTKSLTHELEIRDVEKHSEFQMWHNYLNLTQPFGYALTALGMLNFEYADPIDPAKLK